MTVVENQGRDVAAFLCDLAPQLREYDYACFMHDKKAVQTKPGSVVLASAMSAMRMSAKIRRMC